MSHKLAYMLNRFPHSHGVIANELKMLSHGNVDAEIIALRPTQQSDIMRNPLQTGYKVTYLFGSENAMRGAEFVRDNVRCLVKHPLTYVATALRSLRWAGTNFKHASALAMALSGIKPALVYVNWSWSLCGSVMYACRILKVPFVFSVRGTDITPPARNFSLRVTSAERILTPSDAYANILKNKLNVPGYKIRVVPDCVDFDGFVDVRPGRSEIVGPVRLLSIGSLRAVKRYEDLIRCCSMLFQNGVTFECRIFGDGPRREKLQSLIHEMRLNKCVRLAGAVPRKELVRELEWSDIYVHTSARESFCHAVVEAQASGRPVVASDAVGGIRQSVRPNISATIVPIGQPKEIFKAILELISNPAKRQQMGREGREYVVQKFSYSQVAPIFLNALIGNGTE